MASIRLPYGLLTKRLPPTNLTFPHSLRIAQTFRVLEPGGVADHLWHNDYSLSGNHLADSISRANPWGHLRGELVPKSSLYPRGPDEIRRIFSEFFEVIAEWRADKKHRRHGVDRDFEEEGAELYAGAVSAHPELTVYPRELLVTRCYVIQLRKPCRPPEHADFPRRHVGL